ncbi:MAG: RHS repeat protein [Clostridia bacterium]|nr:RHS repeat protein [Clostridia bacterium]
MRYSQNPTEKYEYSYDANGNVTEIEDKISGKKTTYSYDGLNRLVFERNEAIGNEYTYTYDNGGKAIEYEIVFKR